MGHISDDLSKYLNQFYLNIPVKEYTTLHTYITNTNTNTKQ